MALLQNIYNLVACSASATLGTGSKGCKSFLKKVTTIILTPAGFTFDGAQTLDATYIALLQAQGNAIVLKGIRTFTDNTPDDTMETLEDGTKQTTLLGLYEFALKFINGWYFHAALTSLNSYKNYDITFIDREGNWLGTEAADGSFKGFTTGQIQASKMEWATDTAAQKEGLMFQFLERSEVDSNAVFLDQKTLGFNANLVIDGINEVVLAFTSAPADAATSITASAKLKQGGSAVTGATFADFNLKVDGVTANPTADDSEATGAGIYVLTVGALSANEILALSLYDVANSRAVIDLAGDLYKSNTLTATVV